MLQSNGTVLRSVLKLSSSHCRGKMNMPLVVKSFNEKFIVSPFLLKMVNSCLYIRMYCLSVMENLGLSNMVLTPLINIDALIKLLW